MLTIFTLPEIQRAVAVAEGNYKAVTHAAGSTNPTIFSRLIRYVPQHELAYVISIDSYLIVECACIRNTGLLECLSQTVPASIIEAGVAYNNYAALVAASRSGNLPLFKKVIRYVQSAKVPSAISAQEYAVVKSAARSHPSYALFSYIVSLVPGGIETITFACGSSILSAAAEGGSTDIFAYVLAAISDIAAVLATDNYSILVSAALGGNSYVFQIIAASLAKPIVQIIEEHNYKEVINAAESGHLQLLTHIISLIPEKSRVEAVSVQDYLAVIKSVISGNLNVLEYVLSILPEHLKITALTAHSHKATIGASYGNFAVFQYIESLIGPKQIVAAVTASLGNKCFKAALAAAFNGNPFLLRHILNLIPGLIQEVAVAGNGDLYRWTASSPLIAHVSLAHLPTQHQLDIMEAIISPQVSAIAQVLCSTEHTQQNMIKAITKAQAMFEFYKATPSMYTHPSLSPLSPVSRLIESYRPEVDTTYHYAMAMLNCYEQIALLQIHSMQPTFFSMLLLSGERSTSQIKAITMALRFLHLTSHAQPYTPLPAHLLPYNQVRIVCHAPIFPFFSSKRIDLQYTPDVTLVLYGQQRAVGSARKAIMSLRTQDAGARIASSDSELTYADCDIQATGAAPLDVSSAVAPLMLDHPTSSAYTNAGRHDTEDAITWHIPTAIRPSSTTSEYAHHLPQSIAAEGLYQSAVSGMFLMHNFHSVKYFVQNVLHLDTARALDAITPTHILSADVALGTLAAGANYAAGGAVVPIVQAASIAISTCAAHEITRALHANVLLSQNISAPIHSVSDFAVQCGPQVASGAASIYALSMLAAFTPFIWPPVAGIASAAALNGAMCFNAHNAPKSSPEDHYYIPEALAIGVTTAMLLPTLVAGAPLAVVTVTAVSAISVGAAVHSVAGVILDYASYVVDTAGNHADLNLAV